MTTPALSSSPAQRRSTPVSLTPRSFHLRPLPGLPPRVVFSDDLLSTRDEMSCVVPPDETPLLISDPFSFDVRREKVFDVCWGVNFPFPPLQDDFRSRGHSKPPHAVFFSRFPLAWLPPVTSRVTDFQVDLFCRTRHNGGPRGSLTLFSPGFFSSPSSPTFFRKNTALTWPF